MRETAGTIGGVTGFSPTPPSSKCIIDFIRFSYQTDFIPVNVNGHIRKKTSASFLKFAQGHSIVLQFLINTSARPIEQT